MKMAKPKVKDYMTKDPVYLYVPGHRREAMKIFVKETISGIPVLHEDDDKLVGIITRADIFAKPQEDQLAMLMKKKVISCKGNDGLGKAAKLFLDNMIHRLPVADKNGKLVGIISPLDILPYIEDLELDVTVEGLMERKVVPLYRLIPANVALEIMKFTHTKALPVLDDDAKVSGIITDRDIYAKVRIDTKTVAKELGTETDIGDLAQNNLGNIMRLYHEMGTVEIPTDPIEDIMVSKPQTVQAETTVSKASRIMFRGRYNQLPVVDLNGKLMGMVYDLCLIKVLLD
jgi:CBS domain-containing protein